MNHLHKGCAEILAIDEKNFTVFRDLNVLKRFLSLLQENFLVFFPTFAQLRTTDNNNYLSFYGA